jgi:signal transduction histidine kinase
MRRRETGSTVDRVELPARARRLWTRALRTPPHVIDLVMGAFFVVIGLLSTGATSGPNVDRYEPRDAVAYALILTCAAPYFVRRKAPLPVFLVSSASVAVLSMLGYYEGLLPTFAMVGAYTVGAHRPEREAVLAGVWMALWLTGVYLGDSQGFGAGALAFNIVVFAVAILIGWNVQSRRLRLEALEAEHAATAATAAADERLRIAQEVHDVVAHSLGIIAVQAGVGRHVIHTDPDEAARALDHIAETSRSSLDEIRRLLGAVRDRGDEPGHHPAPTLAELPALVRDLELAGLDVDLDLSGDLSHLPAGMELAAFRIVQEATTNTLRHAAARHVRVRIHGDGDVLGIEVVDDGRGAGAANGPSGHGLVGMQERVAIYGGTVAAGPAPAGGFRVTATLPIDRERVG